MIFPDLKYDKFKLLLSVVSILILLTIGIYLYFNWTSRPSLPRGAQGFDGFKWGSSVKEVVGELKNSEVQERIKKAPIFEDHDLKGTQITVNMVNRDGDTVDVGYVFHPELGLVKGEYKVKFGRGRGCIRVFEKFYNEMKRKNYQLVGENKYNDLKVDFCYAVLVGRAGRYARWVTDSGVRITMILGTEISKRELSIIYETEAFYQWRNKINQKSYYDAFLDRLNSIFSY